MITEQTEFTLKSETKNIIITNNIKNSFVKKIDKALGGKLKSISEEPFTIIHTLGKLQCEKVFVVNFEALNDEKLQEKIIKGITGVKGDTVILVDTFINETYHKFIGYLAERILTDNYQFNKFKSKYKEEPKEFFFYGNRKIYDVVKKGYILGECMNNAKTLVNTPYNYLNATDLANYAKEFTKYDNVEVTIYDKKQIEDMNMGAFLGVNLGSSDEPKLILVKYQGLETFDNPTALVGKGVMYDTGGYSLKTPQSMPGMKVDMAGSAAVLGAIEAIARLQPKANVMAIVAATDNRIGDGAIVPDDILVSANGKTIEIISTDAEGRLTLADAVWFAQEQGAKRVIDTATLTGAMVAALGREFTGAFTNNKEFLNEFKKAAKTAKEDIWEMPVSKGYHKLIESKVADIKNSGGRFAGASTAAAFIEEFINKDTAWIHLDIAGTASTEKGEATGVMVKSFTEFFL
ncbi:MAG: leucyl aminopeptidase [Candidatus Izemoplasma sp.]